MLLNTCLAYSSLAVRLSLVWPRCYQLGMAGSCSKQLTSQALRMCLASPWARLAGSKNRFCQGLVVDDYQPYKNEEGSRPEPFAAGPHVEPPLKWANSDLSNDGSLFGLSWGEAMSCDCVQQSLFVGRGEKPETEQETGPGSASAERIV